MSKAILAGTVASIAIAGIAVMARSDPTSRSAAMTPATPSVLHARSPENAALRCPARRRRYRTRPSFRPVAFCVVREPGAGAAAGHVLVTPRRVEARSRGQNAAMIASDTGRILWYLPRRQRVHDFKTVTYRGETMLALYHRRSRRGSFYELRNRSYRVVARIAMGAPYGTDMHELQITPAGTAYLAAYHPVVVPGVGRVIDYVIREVDVESGGVLFEWHSLDHVPLSASYLPRAPGSRSWDYFHGNSIDPPVPGDPTIIVSSRNTSAVYGIDRATGAVRWTLGGRRDEFGTARRSGRWFCTQHDARRLPNGDITLFDNGGSGLTAGTGCPIHPARVVQLRLDPSAATAEVVRELSSRRYGQTGRPLYPIALGSARRQPNGNTLVSWGTAGRIGEVTPDGRLVSALRLFGSSYRAVRATWVGMPGGRPAVVARRRPDGVVDVWASWNGATQVTHWRVLAGDAPDRLRAVGRPVAFADLETRVRARTWGPLVAVRAVDARGRELGRSRAVRIR